MFSVPYTSTTRMTDLHLARGETKQIIYYIIRELNDMDELWTWSTGFVPAVNFCVFKGEENYYFSILFMSL